MLKKADKNALPEKSWIGLLFEKKTSIIQKNYFCKFCKLLILHYLWFDFDAEWELFGTMDN